MTEEKKDMHRKILRTKGGLRDLHKDMGLILGLHALLELQYIHEGHRDEDVSAQLDEKLLAFESELSDIRARFSLDDLPF